jgi:uncharacterized cupredoxin-like copper-binding protein
MMQRARLATALVALLLAGPACGGSGGASESPTPDLGIDTTLSDFKVVAAETEAAGGEVSFDLENDGPSQHTFFLVETDVIEDDLPVVDNVVDLGDLAVAAESGVIDVGARASVTEDLAAGAYVMFCNLPGHYGAGMHAAFTVT